MDLFAQLCCSACGQHMLNVFHLTLRMDATLAVAPLLITALPPLSPHPPSPQLSLLVSLAQASSLSSGGHTYSWFVSCTAARCHSVLVTVAKRASGHTHEAHRTLPETSQRLSIHHSLHYHTPCTSDRGGDDDVAGGGERGYVLLFFHLRAPSKCFGTVSAVMTLAHFHFHQTRKIPQDEKPELTIAGLKPKLPIATQQRQSQGPGKQINLSYKRQAPVYLNRDDCRRTPPIPR